MPIVKKLPSTHFAQIDNEITTGEDLTDTEYRLYVYYLGQSPNYNISIPKTAVAINKSKRAINDLNQSLINKGYLLIIGNRNPKYYLGQEIVEEARKEHKDYLKKKGERYENIGEKVGKFFKAAKKDNRKNEN